MCSLCRSYAQGMAHRSPLGSTVLMPTVCRWQSFLKNTRGQVDGRPAPKTEVLTLPHTTMSNLYLPPELLDHICDLLRDARGALKNCCLVSKSWIPRTRRHLFARIEFHYPKDLRSWKTTFRDSSVSPACYTRSLDINLSQDITATDAGGGGWIPTFSRVVHMGISITRQAEPPLFLFHRFSPTLESIRVNFSFCMPSSLTDFILSFPRLQDLDITSYYRPGPNNDPYGRPVAIQCSSPPAFTGSLKLCLKMGMKHIASPLLSLPGGIHFRELHLTWYREEDIPLTIALVEGCSSSLETLEIKCEFNSEMFGVTAVFPHW